MNQIRTLASMFLLAAILLAGCTKDPKPTEPGNPVDLNAARFTDFRLQETNYISIQIDHPQLSNGIENVQGEIAVVVPAGAGLELTPLASNFNNAEFTVTPAPGSKQNFSNGPVIYAIASKTQPDKKVHYQVSITEDAATGNTPTVTGFVFEKSKNAQLSADVSAAAIVEGVASMGKIYVLVPRGTDFSNLKPTINISGASLFYSQDPNASPSNATDVYPAGGLAIDFAYPKKFYAVVKQANMVNTYEVIVDVENPLEFEEATVTTPDITAGNSSFIPITRVINRGNHPLSLVSVIHTGQQPAVNAIRASSGFPSSGLLPGERATVNATIQANVFPAGVYRTTAIFSPKIFEENATGGLLEPARLEINSKIID